MQNSAMTITVLVLVCSILSVTTGLDDLHQKKINERHKNHGFATHLQNRGNTDNPCQWICEPESSKGQVIFSYNTTGNVVYGLANGSVAVIIDIASAGFVLLNGETGTAIAIDIKANVISQSPKEIWTVSQISFQDFFNRLPSFANLIESIKATGGQAIPVNSASREVEHQITTITARLGTQGGLKKILELAGIVTKQSNNDDHLLEANGSFPIKGGLETVIYRIRGVEKFSKLLPDDVKKPGGFKFDLRAILNAPNGLEALLLVLQQSASQGVDLVKTYGAIFNNQEEFLGIIADLGHVHSSPIDLYLSLFYNVALLFAGHGDADLVIQLWIELFECEVDFDELDHLDDVLNSIEKVIESQTGGRGRQLASFNKVLDELIGRLPLGPGSGIIDVRGTLRSIRAHDPAHLLGDIANVLVASRTETSPQNSVQRIVRNILYVTNSTGQSRFLRYLIPDFNLNLPNPFEFIFEAVTAALTTGPLGNVFTNIYDGIAGWLGYTTNKDDKRTRPADSTSANNAETSTPIAPFHELSSDNTETVDDVTTDNRKPNQKYHHDLHQKDRRNHVHAHEAKHIKEHEKIHHLKHNEKQHLKHNEKQHLKHEKN